MRKGVFTVFRFRVFKNAVKQGFQGIWRNKGMGAASISSISAVLIILGMVLILTLSVNNAVQDTKMKFDEIEVFLLDDLEDQPRKKIERTISNQPEVVLVEFKSKNEALEDMKEQWGEEGWLLEDLENNPLPDSYIVRVDDVEDAEKVVNNIVDLPGVDRVSYYKDVIDKLLVFSGYIETGGLILTGILLFISIFIISNTIKITVSSRQREINIMKYVGSSNGYIRGPFIMEGIFLGVVGAAISIGVVYFGYSYLYESMNERLYELLTFYLIEPSVIFIDLAFMFLSIGAGIGAIGSIISMKKFLKV